MRASASCRGLSVAVLLIVLGLPSGCGLLSGEKPVGAVLGSTSGDGPVGVAIGAGLDALADQVDAGGTGRPADPALAAQLRNVDPSTAFVYGFRYDACTSADPGLVVRHQRTVEPRTRDLNRNCYQAEPVTAYFVLQWDDLANTFTIGSSTSASGQTRVQDRQVV